MIATYLILYTTSHRTKLTLFDSQVIYKLLAFTFAMIVVPIGSYFLSVNAIFSGTSLHPYVSSSRLRTNRKLFSCWWLGCCLGQCRPCGIHYCSYERGPVGQTKAREQEGQVDTHLTSRSLYQVNSLFNNFLSGTRIASGTSVSIIFSRHLHDLASPTWADHHVW
jgi:hypothetical protein